MTDDDYNVVDAPSVVNELLAGQKLRETNHGRQCLDIVKSITILNSKKFKSTKKNKRTTKIEKRSNVKCSNASGLICCCSAHRKRLRKPNKPFKITNRLLLTRKQYVQMLSKPKINYYVPNICGKPIKQERKNCFYPMSSSQINRLSRPTRKQLLVTFQKYHNVLPASKLEKIFTQLQRGNDDNNKISSKRVDKKFKRNKQKYSKKKSQQKKNSEKYAIECLATKFSIKLTAFLTLRCNKSRNVHTIEIIAELIFWLLRSADGISCHDNLCKISEDMWEYLCASAHFLVCILDLVYCEYESVRKRPPKESAVLSKKRDTEDKSDSFSEESSQNGGDAYGTPKFEISKEKMSPFYSTEAQQKRHSEHYIEITDDGYNRNTQQGATSQLARLERDGTPIRKQFYQQIDLSPADRPRHYLGISDDNKIGQATVMKFGHLEQETSEKPQFSKEVESKIQKPQKGLFSVRKPIHKSDVPGLKYSKDNHTQQEGNTTDFSEDNEKGFRYKTYPQDPTELRIREGDKTLKQGQSPKNLKDTKHKPLRDKDSSEDDENGKYKLLEKNGQASSKEGFPKSSKQSFPKDKNGKGRKGRYASDSSDDDLEKGRRHKSDDRLHYGSSKTSPTDRKQKSSSKDTFPTSPMEKLLEYEKQNGRIIKGSSDFSDDDNKSKNKLKSQPGAGSSKEKKSAYRGWNKTKDGSPEHNKDTLPKKRKFKDNQDRRMEKGSEESVFSNYSFKDGKNSTNPESRKRGKKQADPYEKNFRKLKSQKYGSTDSDNDNSRDKRNTKHQKESKSDTRKDTLKTDRNEYSSPVFSDDAARKRYTEREKDYVKRSSDSPETGSPKRNTSLSPRSHLSSSPFRESSDTHGKESPESQFGKKRKDPGKKRASRRSLPKKSPPTSESMLDALDKELRKSPTRDKNYFRSKKTESENDVITDEHGRPIKEIYDRKSKDEMEGVQSGYGESLKEETEGKIDELSIDEKSDADVEKENYKRRVEMSLKENVDQDESATKDTVKHPENVVKDREGAIKSTDMLEQEDKTEYSDETGIESAALSGVEGSRKKKIGYTDKEDMETSDDEKELPKVQKINGKNSNLENETPLLDIEEETEDNQSDKLKTKDKSELESELPPEFEAANILQEKIRDEEKPLESQVIDQDQKNLRTDEKDKGVDPLSKKVVEDDNIIDANKEKQIEDLKEKNAVETDFGGLLDKVKDDKTELSESNETSDLIDSKTEESEILDKDIRILPKVSSPDHIHSEDKEAGRRLKEMTPYKLTEKFDKPYVEEESVIEPKKKYMKKESEPDDYLQGLDIIKAIEKDIGANILFGRTKALVDGWRYDYPSKNDGIDGILRSDFVDDVVVLNVKESDSDEIMSTSPRKLLIFPKVKHSTYPTVDIRLDQDKRFKYPQYKCPVYYKIAQKPSCVDYSSSYNKPKSFSGLTKCIIPHVNIMPHGTDRICCASLKAWALWIKNVAESAKLWCQWINTVICDMQAITALMRGEVYNVHGVKRVLTCEDWDNFVRNFNSDLCIWHQYNKHVEKNTKQILNYCNCARVTQCCNLCQRDNLQCSSKNINHLYKKLAVALKTAKYWRIWLHSMVLDAQSLFNLIEVSCKNSTYRPKCICKCNDRLAQCSIYSIRSMCQEK